MKGFPGSRVSPWDEVYQDPHQEGRMTDTGGDGDEGSIGGFIGGPWFRVPDDPLTLTSMEARLVLLPNTQGREVVST